jgi:hypothetical protein
VRQPIGVLWPLMPEQVVVFLGPSLPQGEARAILPDADFRPPVRRSSLKPLLENPPAAIGIVDGEFYQSLAISPKEILPFLDRGVKVFGASSMGALRAVELRHEGMKGIGRVYDMYVKEELNSDDEVAMMFCPDTLRPLSEPLVNLRIALAAAAAAGVITSRQRERLVSLMRVAYFPDRTIPALFRAAARVLPAPGVAAFTAWWQADSPDAKADDARELLRQLKDLRG